MNGTAVWTDGVESLSSARFRRVGRGSSFACAGARNQDRVMVVFEELSAVNLANFLSAAAAHTGSNR